MAPNEKQPTCPETEKGVAEELDEARKRNSTETGGMGREETPKDGKTQGTWQNPYEPLPEPPNPRD